MHKIKFKKLKAFIEVINLNMERSYIYAKEKAFGYTNA